VYELFEHTADLGLRVHAPDVDALFREAAEALFAAIVERGDEEGARQAETLRFSLDAEQLDWLLADWLAELLYAFESRRFLLDRFRVRVEGTRLEAEARAVPLGPGSDRLLHEVKAITYHGLRVERDGDGWLAEVIVDI
jgi:SHS2 domain-containing protein